MYKPGRDKRTIKTSKNNRNRNSEYRNKYNLTEHKVQEQIKQ